jgi:predicted Zn-dependent protease
MKLQALISAGLILLFLSVPADAENVRQRANAQAELYVTEEDVKSEIIFGKEVAATILGKYPLYRNEGMTRYVNLVAKSLAKFSNRPELDFTVGILDTNMVNGISAPGGYIFITRGAIEAMDDEAELAGVLAHEIIHVSEKHIVKELNIHGSDSSAAAGLSHLIGGSGESVKVAISTAMGEAMKILFERGYKKNDEMEADRLGVQLATMAGYDPTALNRYFAKLKTGKSSETASIEKIHQPFDDRIQLLSHTIDNSGLPGNGFSGKDRFKKFVSWNK